MRETLFIRIPCDPRAEWSWLLRDAGGMLGEVQSGTDTAALAHAAIGRQLVVVIPGQDVMLTAATFPDTDRSHLLKALPFAIEEQLAADVDAQHLAIPDTRPDAHVVPVAVVARATMDEWLARLRACGIEPHYLLPDTLLLPVADDTWTLLLDQQCAILRQDRFSGFTVDSHMLQPWLAAAVARSAGPPQRLHIIDARNNATSDPIQPIAAFDGEVTQEVTDEPLLALFARNFQEHDTINLLQGHYSRRERMGPLWRPWKRVAAVFAAWVLIAMGGAAAELVYLQQQNAALRERIETVFRQAFPDVRNVVNPRVQMEQRLKEMRGTAPGSNDGFLELATRAANGVRSTPKVRLTGLNYRDTGLDLEFSAPDFETVEQLKRQIEEQGLQVEILSASASQSNVDARIRLSGGS